MLDVLGRTHLKKNPCQQHEQQQRYDLKSENLGTLLRHTCKWTLEMDKWTLDTNAGIPYNAARKLSSCSCSHRYVSEEAQRTSWSLERVASTARCT